MPTSPIVQLQLAIGVLAIALALWKGGAPERLAALAVSVNLAGAVAAWRLRVRQAPSAAATSSPAPPR